MPQWDFMNFIAEQARGIPTFHLKMQAEVVKNHQGNGRVTGVRAKTPEGDVKFAGSDRGSDARHSVVAKGRLEGHQIVAAPMDVMWRGSAAAR